MPGMCDDTSGMFAERRVAVVSDTFRDLKGFSRPNPKQIRHHIETYSPSHELIVVTTSNSARSEEELYHRSSSHNLRVLTQASKAIGFQRSFHKRTPFLSIRQRYQYVRDTIANIGIDRLINEGVKFFLEIADVTNSDWDRIALMKSDVIVLKCLEGYMDNVGNIDWVLQTSGKPLIQLISEPHIDPVFTFD
ncbi:hypothetical protein OCU04_010512 [Sclerotinia nivalis]|uniref:Uncharacterized protein n=1 Tax=Sclerotinia nivalis TaxID=352851 RepID=A0A9X0DF37_9HELO|nr:hypothetical protein OCU04_010512 [Sclerotinia nivalis]